VNVDLGIWSKLTKAVVALLIIAVLLIIGLCYLPLIHENERMRRDIDNLDRELQEQQELSKQLQAQIEALRDDPKTVERLARDKLGYARPDETIVRFETNATNVTGR
jgi:cell division protein FtsB